MSRQQNHDELSRELDRLRQCNRNLESLLYEAENRVAELDAMDKVNLSESKKRLDLALTAGRLGTWDKDMKTGAEIWSDQHFRILGFEPGETTTDFRVLRDRLHPEDLPLFNRVFDFVTRQGGDIDLQLRLLEGNGAVRWIELRGHTDYDEQGLPLRNYGVSMDITEQKRQDEERYKNLIENAPFPITITRITDGTFRYLNKRAKYLFGFSGEEWLGQPITRFYQIPTERRIMVERLEQHGVAYDLMVRMLDHHSQPFVALVSAVYADFINETSIMASLNDITPLIKKEEELCYLSLHDPQTGLMNRNALNKMIMENEAAADSITAWSALIINLDNFRVINETSGHSEGDRTLLEVAHFLKSRVGSKGLVYRYSGDEFIVLVRSDDFSYVYDLAKGILDGVSTQMYIEKRFVYLTASIGVSIGKPGESIVLIMKNADTALYVAKKTKNTIIVYNLTMKQTRTRETFLEEDMSIALENDEFELYFQPIVDVKNGVINQAEALLRWNHPEYGQVSPAEFIPIAERTKLILPISNWVLRQACHRLAEWATLGLPKISLSINLSPACFENRGNKLAEEIIYTLSEYGVDPSCLKLEITESLLMNDPVEITKTIKRLEDVGVRLALDDFGTGYSAFAQLMDMPLDIAKIDRSLIKAIGESSKGQKIVQSLIAILHGLELDVVAEGVETAGQFLFLKNNDCRYVQGYLFSRPLPNQSFIEYCLKMKEPGKVLDHFLKNS